MNLLFLDTETTGIGDNARLVQVAFKSSFSNEIIEGKFKPPVPIEIGAMAIHHITNKEVDGLEKFEDSYIYEALTTLLSKNILVAHNAPFDIKILENEGFEAPDFIDTMVCAKHIVQSERHGLQYLRYFLDVEVEAIAHDAAGDVKVLVKVYEKLAELVKEKFELEGENEIQKKLMELSRTPVILQYFGFGKYRGKTFEEVNELDRGYLKWLHASETKKPDGEQKKDLVYTLEHFLNEV